MAADSIAKLAIILTGDASPLSASLQKSLRDVDRWALGMQRASIQAAASWNAGLAKIAAANEAQRLSAPGGPMAAFDPGQLSARIPSSAFGWIRETINPLDQLSTKMRSFVTHTDSLTSATLRMGMAMSAARGNIAAMVNLGLSGGPATWLVASAAAAGALAFKLAAVSDAQKALAEGGNTANTWAGQWDRVQENAEKIGVTLGRPIASVLTRETQQLADILGLIADTIMPDTIRQEQQKIAILKEQKRLTEEQAKIKRDLEQLTAREVEQFKQLDKDRIALRAKSNMQGGLNAADAKELRSIQSQERSLLLASQLRKAEEEFGRNLQADLDALKAKADALAASLRTPKEEFVAALREANELFDAGKLSAGMLERAATSAGVKLLEAEKVRKRAHEQANQGVAATDRFTTAGFSAVQQGQRELQHIEQVSMEQLEEQKRQTEIEQEIAQILNDRLSRPIVLMEGTPP